MIEQLQASAGSGKTYRLTRRFLALLLESGSPAPACGPVPGQGYGPESILAITFTNKAATEMKERVLRALKSLALGLPDPDFNGPVVQATAKAWLEKALRHLQLLNIRTIDSLLHQLARLFALELGLPPDFEALLDDALVFEALYDDVTARMDTGDPALSAMLVRITDSLIFTEGVAGFWLGDKARARLLKVFRHLLAGQGHTDVDDETLRQEMEGLGQGLRMTAATLKEQLAKAGVEPLSAFSGLLGKIEILSIWAGLPDADTFAYKAGLDDCVKKDSKDRLTRGLEALYQEFRHTWAMAKARGPMLQKVLAALPFLELGQTLDQAFERYRRDRGVALLSQLAGKVAHLLAEGDGVPEAYCRLGARLHHLLIDEFQDTSLSQWSVLSQLAQECLSKGGSLFYVGDVKQAIYGWRGGEAALFENVARQPELLRIAPVHTENLPFNRRSAPVVVDFNNRVFESLALPEVSLAVAMALLPESPEAVRLGLAQAVRACFEKARQDLPPGRDDGSGFVRIRRLPGDKREAYEASVRQEFVALFTDDLLKRRPLRDIAVLTRSNREAARAAQWLVDMQVNVVTENSLRLAEHPIIQGALGFLAFLDYPPDGMALWRFLACGELFGRSQNLGREELTDWLAVQSPGLLYRKFQRDFPEIWQRLFEPFLHGSALTTPYDLIQELFTACDVWRAYPQDEVFLRRFLELVHNAETQGFGSLSTFLEFWNQKGHQEKIPQPEEAQAVRVLTIHKAKGLEFPVVVVPFHHFPAGSSTELADFAVDGQSMTALLIKELGEPFHQHMAKVLLEQLNLLYVAWTRPVQELHAFLPASERLCNKAPLAKALEVIQRAVGIDCSQPETVFGRVPLRQGSLIPGAAAMPQEHEGSGDERPPAKRLPAEGLAAQQPTSERPPAERPASDRRGAPSPSAEPVTVAPPLSWLPGLKILRSELGDPMERLRLSERKRGIVLHKALEILCLGGDRLEDSRLAVRRAMAALGLRDTLVAEEPQDCQAVQEPLDSPPPEGRSGNAAWAENLAQSLVWLTSLEFFPHCHGHGLREAELLDENGARHRPDLLLFGPEETLVLDYKTGREDPDHHKQLRRYLSLAAGLPQAEGRPVRGLLLYVDARQVREVAP